MDRERWQRVEEIFHAALERTIDERAAFVAQVCGDDTTLRDEIAALLKHDDPNASFMEIPALAAFDGERRRPSGNGAERDTAEATLLSDTPPDVPHAAGELPAGHRIENYRIVRKIGSGGMGDVYLAEDLHLGRRVALKLLPPAIHADGKSGRRFLREARAASQLNHPSIVTIHSVNESAGVSFIEMEFIEGESLRERLLRGPLEPAEVISLGLEAAEAATAAHAINIVHRDLKPGNILLTPSGAAKIVDFGLAKMAGAAGRGGAVDVSELPTGLSSFSLSQAGSVSGTVPYMSPEQTRGEHVDARSDIFSLGTVLYEAATGRRPFDGDHPAEIIRKIRDVDPPRPSAVRAGVARGLDGVILKALAKDKAQRFSSAVELAAALRRLQTRERVRRFVQRAWIPATVTVVLLAVVLGWWQWRQNRLEWARTNLTTVEQLVDEDRYFEAHDLFQQAAAYLPSDDPQVRELRPWVTDVLSVSSEPAGASVYLRRYQRDGSGEFPPRQLVGTTPIRDLSIARGDYVVTVEEEGYVPFRRTISSALARFQDGPLGRSELRHVELVEPEPGSYDLKVDSDAPFRISVRLLDAASATRGMVLVPGGKYHLHGWGRPTDDAAQLDDFFIDQYEVTNREYKEFVDAGGYADRRFWTHAFLQYDAERDQSEELTWEEGMALLVDGSGLPGPRGWSRQEYPAGKDDHPVADVTWYEAAAYAEFRGKQLPTIFQWEKAARDDIDNLNWGITMPWGVTGVNDDVTDRANVMSAREHDGTTPVGSFEFGLSPWGCYDMAGNVFEWCRNSRPIGFTTAASSWREGPHMFSGYGQFPGFYSTESLGFRCVQTAAGAGGDQGAMPLPNTDERGEYAPVSAETFALMRMHYEYDRPRPDDADVNGDEQRLKQALFEDLDVRIVEEVETDDWRRLKISFIGAERQRSEGPVPEEKRALAYLWLPRNARPPYQVVNYKPGGPSYNGVTASQETEVVCGPIILSGRALFVTVVQGMRERDLPQDWAPPDAGSVAHRDMMIYDTLDQRRGLDYLETRDDIDLDRIVCMGLSMGGYDLVTMAVEDRFQGVLLLSAGLGAGARRTIAAANPINFAPYIRGRKMMIHGRYDEGIPFRTAALPLYDLLSEPKKHVWLESGHFPAMDMWVPHALQFLEETLGPVETVDGAAFARGRE